ncbi:hypothetical protein [uncultured Azohydromonas sp.]|jgi:hypothetical protein|uniref:hypothetical protein n=1 Tax=uncultured Azohydromonas sp. TaxID=487342 RepID=UPI00260DC15A|nr:hypothetical protein [uncultured Azohydromonas sp.]
MAKTKVYQTSAARREDALAATEVPGGAPSLPYPGGARIDMVALLGSDARFACGVRTFDFNAWLGRGIDAWVWATVACLRAMLLSGTRQTSTVTRYAKQVPQFLSYLTEGRVTPRVATPADLCPLHIETYISWMRERARCLGWTEGSTRTIFKSVKAVVLEMFTQGFILGEPTRFFRRAPLPRGDGGNRHTGLSDAEQGRLAQAIKADLVAAHHQRLMLIPRDVQALRLLLVAHRQGTNLTPLLELHRDAMAPGVLPGTIRIRTVKYRGKTIKSGVGRAGPGGTQSGPQCESDMVFALAEAAVLQQAVKSTEALVDEAPVRYKNRVWLYRSEEAASSTKGLVTCLTSESVSCAIRTLVKRHQLRGDDDQPLRLNFSRLRKSFFERALRLTDGDLAKTANLMGNTPQVSALHYGSLNDARKAEAARFMNEDYAALMRGGAMNRGGMPIEPCVIAVSHPETERSGMPSSLPQPTPVSGCKDTLNGEHAPRDGHNHCDRYVMCLFCSSFAVTGTVQELWRLLSFQAFAKAELEHLDAALGPERGSDDALEELRDRYRVAISFIDDFTHRQFPPGNVRQARAKTETCLHPFWYHQMTVSRRARTRQPEPGRDAPMALLGGTTEDRHGPT